ncbi:MAG: diaminopimelate epimerase [Candidatus Nanohalarchaeota archaeon]|nr:MAG: diaminopimelate epimerase [Candidatus Nanohaloarchaeota archaeon]
MQIRFTKMHGLGNDYIFINCFEEILDNVNLKELAISMSKPHYGIGSDGIILILPPKSEENDFKYRVFNSDGSEAEMCGNGIRCAAKYVYDHNLTKKTKLRFETKAGIIIPELILKKDKVLEVRVDMGEPIIEREKIPMKGPTGRVINEDLNVDNKTLKITSVSMGNPHCIIFTKDTQFKDFEQLGKTIETHNSFPNKTNVEFIQVLNKKEIIMRVWERAEGETLACGTGACASAVACVLNKKTDRTVTVHLKGGDLKIEWDKDTNHVFMTGPAVEVFDGIWKQ